MENRAFRFSDPPELPGGNQLFGPVSCACVEDQENRSPFANGFAFLTDGVRFTPNMFVAGSFSLGTTESSSFSERRRKKNGVPPFFLPVLERLCPSLLCWRSEASATGGEGIAGCAAFRAGPRMRSGSGYEAVVSSSAAWATDLATSLLMLTMCSPGCSPASAVTGQTAMISKIPVDCSRNLKPASTDRGSVTVRVLIGLLCWISPPCSVLLLASCHAMDRVPCAGPAHARALLAAQNSTSRHRGEGGQSSLDEFTVFTFLAVFPQP